MISIANFQIHEKYDVDKRKHCHIIIIYSM